MTLALALLSACAVATGGNGPENARTAAGDWSDANWSLGPPSFPQTCKVGYNTVVEQAQPSAAAAINVEARLFVRHRMVIGPSQHGGSCANGELAPHNARTEEHHCGSCDDGYTLNNKACNETYACTEASSGADCASCAEPKDRARTNHCAECNTGYHLEPDGTCDDHTPCAPGAYESKAATLLADRECSACPPGYRCPGDHAKHACSPDSYQPQGNQTSCLPCADLDLDAHHTFTTNGQTGQEHCSPVPVNCSMGTWSSWGTCSQSCGVGTQARTRSETTAAWGGGAECTEATAETQPCNLHSCPVDCEVSDWSAWGDRCTTACGGNGTVTRSRESNRTAAWGGAACPALTQETPCNAHSCGYKPECDQAHVHCHIAVIKQYGLEVRVPRMTHHRKFMHIDANYECKMSHGDTRCTCTCDKQPPCCLAKNLILTNEVLKGNRFANVSSTHECCDMCYTHPQCTSWEFAELGGAQGNVCVLKTGTPQYEKNPAFPTITYVGTPSRTSLRPGQSSCDPPFFVERDPSIAGIHPGPGSVGGQGTTGPHQLHPFAGVPHETIEVADHQMLGAAVNGLPGQEWVEAEDHEAVGSALEWQRGRVDVRDQPQGQD